MAKNGIFEKIKISHYRCVLIKNAVIGGLVGYFVLHPLVMLGTCLMHFHPDEFIHLYRLLIGNGGRFTLPVEVGI